MGDNKHILVIHGPNMNLIGLRIKNITLDKLNNHLRNTARMKHLKLRIFQTNEESKAANILQRYRKKVSGIILFPGPWQQSGYVLQDTLELINLPFVTVSIGEKAQLLQGGKNIEEANLFTGCEKAVSFLAKIE